VLAVFALLAGCGSAVPEPVTTKQPPTIYAPVPYPPPAAFVELVPKAPNKEAVWIDGSWTWHGVRYVWRRGGWVKPPAGGHYAPWKISYRTDGTVWFAPAGWFDQNGRKLSDPDVIVSAGTPANELTSEEMQSGQ